MTDLKAIELLIKMKEHGITQEEIDAFKAKYNIIPPDAPDQVESFFGSDMTDEEILYYATPYYDEIQTKKELQQQRIKEEDDK